VPRTTANSVDAICRGAGDGFSSRAEYHRHAYRFIAIIALANYVVGWPQTHLGVKNPVTLQMFFGWVNAPFAFLMGIPAQDCVSIGQILGERIVLNEFVGYLDLTEPRQDAGARPAQLHNRDLRAVRLREFSSIAIQVGGIGSLAPERRSGNGQARIPRDGRRPARRLHDRMSRGLFALSKFRGDYAVQMRASTIRIEMRQFILSAAKTINFCVRTKFVDYLPTRAAGSRGARCWCINHNRRNLSRTAGNGLKNGVSFGADRQAKRSVFNITTGKNPTSAVKNSSAHRKMTVWAISLLAAFTEAARNFVRTASETWVMFGFWLHDQYESLCRDVSHKQFLFHSPYRLGSEM